MFFANNCTEPKRYAVRLRGCVALLSHNFWLNWQIFLWFFIVYDYYWMACTNAKKIWYYRYGHVVIQKETLLHVFFWINCVWLLHFLILLCTLFSHAKTQWSDNQRSGGLPCIGKYIYQSTSEIKLDNSTYYRPLQYSASTNPTRGRTRACITGGLGPMHVLQNAIYSSFISVTKT